MDGQEQAILDRVRAGETDAFQEVVARHGRDLYRLALRMTGDPGHAEDVVQETFLRAYRRLHRFDGRSRLGTWLHRIAANCALDLLRRRQRYRKRFTALEDGHAPASAAPGPDRVLASLQIDDQVHTALAALSPMERTAFVLRHFEQQSMAEIGRALGARSGAARQAVFRAVHKLRQALGPWMEKRPCASSTTSN